MRKTSIYQCFVHAEHIANYTFWIEKNGRYGTITLPFMYNHSTAKANQRRELEFYLELIY